MTRTSIFARWCAVGAVVGISVCALTSIAGGQALTVRLVLPPFSGSPTATTPARLLFARASQPSVGVDRSIGFYSNGCLDGASVMPLSGPTWQVMRPSRHRFYGRARLVDFIQRFSRNVAETTRWPGVLVGDMSQPRGGPMLAGHISHQTGLDVDIWLKPMSAEPMSLEMRETQMSEVVVDDTGRGVGSSWTDDHLAVLKMAAEDEGVDRVLVNPAIKKAMCETATGDRAWLRKIRPAHGHDYHMHVRLRCLAGEDACTPQAPIAPGDGCGASVARWLTHTVAVRLPPDAQPKSAPRLQLGSMPEHCKAIASLP